ncbi:MAG: cyanophycinase [Bacteroidetes bacterium 4484_276]|nr:MAG: cyanophycinase [Bacteroidetes bacterium 4484_276]
MKRKPFFLLVGIFLYFLLAGCDSSGSKKVTGKLFIIGGGKRPPELMQQMIDAAALTPAGYIIILPFSSSEPNESATLATQQFRQLGIKNIKSLFLNTDSLLTSSGLDSVRGAGMVYITGGDQNKFMIIAQKTGLDRAIHDAYKRGVLIAGTSAGAALMSKKMITGNQLSLAVYSGNFKTIHKNNIELSAGLGLLENVIIDQHFINRMRMNRLISVAIENPGETCIGIDESTALLVDGKKATVIGSSQVVVLTNNSKQVLSYSGLLGAENITLRVKFPGQSFDIY